MNIDISTVEIIFWGIIFIIFYIYIGYPAVVYVLARVFNKSISYGDYQPNVSIIISAFNEEDVIARTIENKLKSNYPLEKIEIIVVSDESTDDTDKIIKEYAEKYPDIVTYHRQIPRRGKTAAINYAATKAKGDILVLSDANSIYSDNSIGYLVENFSDNKVGYVTGHMIYTNKDGSIIGDGCSSYMKYENFLRKNETRIGSVVGVDGGIDAVKKSLYKEMRDDQIPDFVLPLRIAEQKYRVVYEPRAILREEALNSSFNEYRMRVRVSLRAMWALFDLRQMLNVFRFGMYSWQLFSHKVLRYLAFIFLITLYPVNIILLDYNSGYTALFIAQNVFYIFGYVGYLCEKCNKKITLFSIPYYFCLLNISSAIAFFKFIRREKQIIWNPRLG